MKNPIPFQRRGFTLVELLVVIMIIIVLAGLSLTVSQRVLLKAKKTAALAVCTEISQSVNLFYDDYSTMPIDLADDTDPTSPIATSDANGDDNTEGLELITVLLGKEVADPPRNNRGIKYLNVKQGENDRDGMMVEDDGDPIGIFDPWGNSYYIILDGDFDEAIDVPAKGGSTARTLQRRVAVYTDGAEGATGKATDNVKSW